MKHPYLIPALLPAVFALLALSCRNTGNNESGSGRFTDIRSDEQADSLKTLIEGKDRSNLYGDCYSYIRYFSNRNNMQEVQNFSRRIFKNYKTDRPEIAGLAATYISVPYFRQNMPDTCSYYLDFAIRNTTPESKHYMLLCNTKALYALKFDMNYPLAMKYFLEAYKGSLANGEKDNAAINLTNIANIYIIKKDTNCYRYAEEAHRMAYESRHKFVICFTALNLAQSEIVRKKYDNVYGYCEEALLISQSEPGLKMMLSDIYMTIAYAYTLQYKYDLAYMNYQKAFRYSSYIQDDNSRTKLYLTYGKYLFDTKDYRQALKYFILAQEVSENNRNLDDLNNIYFGLARIYSRLGMKDSSIAYYNRHSVIKDSLFNFSKESQINQLLLDNEKLKHDKEMEIKQLELRNRNRLITFIAICLALSSVILAMIFIMYRRKNRMYIQNVQQYENYRKKITELKLGDLQKVDAKNKNEMEIWNNLEELMNVKKIYRDKNISLESLAETLDTNRSYLSNIVNKYAGMSLPNYINSFRISEAIAIISDPDKDIILKAVFDEVGYNSISSFYRAFQKETGCPPKIYREKILQMRKDRAE